MTDKQIIIDGCDVSGCEHFSVHSCNGCCAYFLENEDTVVGCEKYPNCYYKQLLRKEQECEELNADNISLRDRVGKLERAILRRNEQLDQLKQTLAEIKEIAEDESYIGFWDEQISKILQIISEVEDGTR